MRKFCTLHIILCLLSNGPFCRYELYEQIENERLRCYGVLSKLVFSNEDMLKKHFQTFSISKVVYKGLYGNCFGLSKNTLLDILWYFRQITFIKPTLTLPVTLLNQKYNSLCALCLACWGLWDEEVLGLGLGFLDMINNYGETVGQINLGLNGLSQIGICFVQCSCIQFSVMAKL